MPGQVTDFAVLFHAYGRATDTPAHLAALAAGDDAARTAGVRHLWSAILHQGTPWTATGPVAMAVGRLLDDPRLSDERAASLRGDLLDFLADVADAVNQYRDDASFARTAGTDWDRFDADLATRFASLVEENDGDEEGAYESLFEDDEDFADRLLARGFVGCAHAAAHLVGPVLRRLDDADPAVRGCAAEAGEKVLTTWRAAVALGFVREEPDQVEAAGALAARLDSLAATRG